MRRPRSLSRRLILGAVVWILLGLSASGIVLSFIFEQTVRGAFEENLSAQLRAVMAALKIDDAGRIAVPEPLDDVRYRQVQSGWYWQIKSPDGFMVRSRSLWDEALPQVLDTQPGQISFSDLPGPRGQNLRAAATIVNRQSVNGILIVAAVDTAPLNAQLQRFNVIIFAALGTLGLGLGLAVVLLVVIGLRPLRRLVVELNAIRDGEQEQLTKDHPREVAPLAEAFNDVRKHDYDTLAKARREVGNLAHSLKTPLAQLVTDLDTLPVDLRRRFLPHTDDLKTKIDFYASRAATAAARGVTARRIDVRAVVDDIITALQKIHAESPKAVSISVPSATYVLAEEEDMTEVVGNLLDNAFKWARSRIDIAALPEADDFAVIRVDDDGPGVPDELIAEILQGRRLDEAVPGTGLGLQVVRDIAQAYGGDLTLARSPLGGLRVAVRLPVRRKLPRS